MATRPEPFKLQQKSLMKVYEGTRPYTRAAGDDYGFGLDSGGDEKFYHDELGNEVTGFDPKTHQVVGTLGAENVSSITGKKTYQRIQNPEGPSSLPAGFPKFGTAYSGPMAKPQPYSGPMARPSGDKPLNIGSLMSGGKAAPSAPAAPSNPAATADAVRASASASAAGPAPQLSIAEQQAADIRKRGGMTASDFDRENVAIGNTIYKEGYGVDITTPEGRLQSRKDAYKRMRPNALQGSGVIEGPNGAYSSHPDAIYPDGRNRTNRERAYDKHFGEDGNWVGDNPLTGKFKDKDGDVWDSYNAYDAIANTPAIEPEPVPELNTNEPQFSWERPDFIPPVFPAKNNPMAAPSQASMLPEKPFGPTNGPENFDFGPLRRARAAFYRDKGVTDMANSLIPKAIDKFDPASAVRNMGQMPMRMAKREFPALTPNSAMTSGGLRRNGMPPVRTITNNNQKPWSAYGFRYPVGQ